MNTKLTLALTIGLFLIAGSASAGDRFQQNDFTSDWCLDESNLTLEQRRIADRLCSGGEDRDRPERESRQGGCDESSIAPRIIFVSQPQPERPGRPC